MRFISKYRKHRFASPLLLLFALFGIGLTFSVASATEAPKTVDAAARSTLIAEGQQIF